MIKWTSRVLPLWNIITIPIIKQIINSSEDFILILSYECKYSLYHFVSNIHIIHIKLRLSFPVKVSVVWIFPEYQISWMKC